MVLTPHAVIGAVVAIQFPENPALGVAAAFASHFVLDAIPHWHYSVPAIKEAKRLMSIKPFTGSKNGWRDLTLISGDFFLGFIISATVAIAIGKPVIFAALWGAAAGVFPDFLQFVYFILPKPPLSTIYNFHMWIHAKKRLDNQPFVGISQQILLVALGILAVFL